MQNMMFLEKLKKELRPNDVVLKEVDYFIEKINALLKKECVNAKCVRGGSTAKGTFLEGDHDVDLFVIFDHSYRKKDISKILEDALKPLKLEVVHGSRDYFQYKANKLVYEIVPVLEVKDPDRVENVTDMSPLHVEWVNRRVDSRLRDNIRLAKKFCKAQKVYGAESYIGGFSGHVIDILVIHYGGFLNLLKAAKDWKPKVVVDIEKHHKDPLKSLDKSKTSGPLVVIDPIQKYRNAAAAVSGEKLEAFIRAAKSFLENPSRSFFIEKEFDIKEIEERKRGNALIVLDIKPLKGKADIVGAKLLKAYDFFKKRLELHGFTIVESDWRWDKIRNAQMYFLVKGKLLPKTFVRSGPPLKKRAACAAFSEKNEDVFEKGGRLYANVPRAYRKPEELIKALSKDEYVLKKVERIRVR